ncbi:MAG: hypothetical protein AAGG45_09640, partial [Pseudomonadota bacterium]
DEGEFPSRLWQRSSNETLLTLMRNVKTTRITPAERLLLRRVILSPTREPQGEKADELLAERARLMLALGEAEAAASLVPRLKTEARGVDAETLAVDVALARGDEVTACRRPQSAAALPSGMYWMKLRAVCAILRDDFGRAEFALELATTQGLDDPWFINAIFAASGDVPNPPNARFDSGLNIALSTKAELDTSRITTSPSRPDLAAAAAQRPGVPAQLAEQFAALAVEAGLLSPQEQRRILMARLQDDAYVPENAIQAAILASRDSTLTAGEKAQKIERAMRGVRDGDFSGMTATVQLLLPELKRLPRLPETAEYAVFFAKVALIVGDNRLAQSWLGAAESAGFERADEFEIAKLDAINLISGGDMSPPSQMAVQDRLIEASESERQKREAAKILLLWQGFDLVLRPEARTLISQYDDRGERVSAGRLSAIEAASKDGAIGETALRILAVTNRAPDRLSARDVAELISALRRIGADDIARSLAVEAAGIWPEKLS